MPGTVAERTSERVSALRAARLERGWSLRDLAERLWAEANRQDVRIGTHPSSLRSLITGWELGRRVPSPVYLRLLTAIYGQTPTVLGLPELKAPVSMDSEVLGELFARYRRFVWGWHYRRVLDFHLAEDLTSDTFIKAAEAVEGVDVEHAHGWLAKQAGWVLADYCRLQRTKRERLAGVDDDGRVPDWAADDAMSRTEETVTGRLSALAMIEGLSERERELIVLRYLEGLSMVAVEKRMGLSKTTARRVLNRALVTMRCNAVVVWDLPSEVRELGTAA